MREKLSVAVAGIGLLVVAAVPVWAHHSFWVEFDVNKPVRLQGTITKMKWINPHAWRYIDVTTPDGAVEKWMIEGGVPNVLFRRGFTTKSLLPGKVVTVEGQERVLAGKRRRHHVPRWAEAVFLIFGTNGDLHKSPKSEIVADHSHSRLSWTSRCAFVTGATRRSDRHYGAHHG